jgi:hypothetical protein
MRPSKHHWFAGLATIVVVAAVVAAIAVVESPAKERQRRLDQVRTQDLRAVQRLVNAYWKLHTSLPENLIVLSQAPGFEKIPTDPQTQQPYEYSIVGKAQFRLCAAFARDSSETQLNNNYYSVDSDWFHVKGRQCFELKIDKNLVSD